MALVNSTFSDIWTSLSIRQLSFLIMAYLESHMLAILQPLTSFVLKLIALAAITSMLSYCYPLTILLILILYLGISALPCHTLIAAIKTRSTGRLRMLSFHPAINKRGKTKYFLPNFQAVNLLRSLMLLSAQIKLFIDLKRHCSWLSRC